MEMDWCTGCSLSAVNEGAVGRLDDQSKHTYRPESANDCLQPEQPDASQIEQYTMYTIQIDIQQLTH
jgi:hypothetical protein